MHCYSLSRPGQFLLPLLLLEQLATPALCSFPAASQAQVIDQKSFNVLSTTKPPAEVNGTNVVAPPPHLSCVTWTYLILQIFVPPGSTLKSLLERPFHVYDDEFLSILGENPHLTRIAHSPKDPLFHEAVVW